MLLVSNPLCNAPGSSDDVEQDTTYQQGIIALLALRL
jgi:hypothetical protein